jgi:hypothetical protein
MKRIINSLILLSLLTFSSCEDPGVSNLRLTGFETNLPDELKGLKVYNVSTGSGTWVKVAVLNDKINSTTYTVGKTTETVIYLKKPTKDSLIKISQIVMENDSMILCRK